MLFLRFSVWLEHPALRYVLAASWPAAQGCVLIGFSTGWFWRQDGLAFVVPAVPLALWFVVGVFGWRRARVSAALGVARVWLVGHVIAGLVVEVLNVVVGERWLLVSHGWLPPSASLSALGAFYLMGSAFVLLWTHGFVASVVVALRRRPLPRPVEWGFGLILAGWLVAGGVVCLLPPGFETGPVAEIVLPVLLFTNVFSEHGCSRHPPRYSERFSNAESVEGHRVVQLPAGGADT